MAVNISLGYYRGWASRRAIGRRLVRSNVLSADNLIGVAGRGEIGGARIHDVSNGYADGSILKHRFDKIVHIINDDVRAGCAQVPDVGAEREQAVECGAKR